MRAHVTLFMQSCTVLLRETATSLVVKSAARVQIDATLGCDVQGLVALQPTNSTPSVLSQAPCTSRPWGDLLS
jgi:hypothetical protein